VASILQDLRFKLRTLAVAVVSSLFFRVFGWYKYSTSHLLRR